MPSRTAITIGNFDGVHVGHQSLLSTARNAVGQRGRVLAVTFEPHPSVVLRPEAPPARLANDAQRRELLLHHGADDVSVLPVDAAMLSLQPEEFVCRCVRQFSPDVFVEGEDFRFGRGRKGDVNVLAKLGRSHGFDVIVAGTVEVTLADHSIAPASSSLVRWLVGEGRVRDAASVLKRPFELCAKVVKGDQRGRELNMPTANLDMTGLQMPADAIYAGRGFVERDEAWYPAAISVGSKPTFGGLVRTCEAHLIGYHGPLDNYGWTLRLQLHHWLRDQLSFERIESLISQMKRDVDQVSMMMSIGHDRRKGVALCQMS